jgi:6,7-dimethyl-8-ribityllumazine synthase
VEGTLVVPPGTRFALVASRFNHFIVDRLVEGALDAIARHGGKLEDALLVRVPGAWEMPNAVRRLAMSGKIDAIIALGAVIRGSTPHFDYVAAEVTKGIAHVSLDTGVPWRSACSPPTPSSRRWSARGRRPATRAGSPRWQPSRWSRSARP